MPSSGSRPDAWWPITCGCTGRRSPLSPPWLTRRTRFEPGSPPQSRTSRPGRLPERRAPPVSGTVRAVGGPPIALVGDGTPVRCLDGTDRPYLSLDAAASTAALPAVWARVEAFIPSYSSVHRGAGYKSRLSTDAYEDARAAVLDFAGRSGRDDVAIICRNTTEALKHLAYRLNLGRDDVVVTTVVEHHANLLPWARVASCRYVECGPEGTFEVADVDAALDAQPRPALLALTGASNVTGWLPPVTLDAPVSASRAGRGWASRAASTSATSKVPSGPHSTYRQEATRAQGSRLAWCSTTVVTTTSSRPRLRR